MKTTLAAAALVAVGSLQMIGDVAHVPAIKAAGAITHASPAPKVFTAQSGFETFSSRFYIDWRDTSGTAHTLELTPREYAGLAGPYNRRNAYGAALSYAPVLVANPATRAMHGSVTQYAFCGDAPLLREIGIRPENVVGDLRLRLEPRDEKSRARQWQTRFSIACEHGARHG
jgi:hypothetical protein